MMIETTSLKSLVSEESFKTNLFKAGIRKENSCKAPKGHNQPQKTLPNISVEANTGTKIKRLKKTLRSFLPMSLSANIQPLNAPKQRWMVKTKKTKEAICITGRNTLILLFLRATPEMNNKATKTKNGKASTWLLIIGNSGLSSIFHFRFSMFIVCA